MVGQCLMIVLPGEAESSQVHMAKLDREGELGDVGRAPAQKSIEDLTEVRIDTADPNKFFLVGSQLPETEKTQLLDLLLENKEIFVWTPYEMPDIDPAVMCHKLNVNPNHKPVIQKARRTGVPQTEAVKEEVEKLLEVQAIKEVHYSQWLANTVVVKKKTGLQCSIAQPTWLQHLIASSAELPTSAGLSSSSYIKAPSFNGRRTAIRPCNSSSATSLHLRYCRPQPMAKRCICTSQSRTTQ
ncbi:hypothetical protein AAC387_Pa08g1467 [Persea americana]